MANPKYIFVQLRGGMDGLAALMPSDNSVLLKKRAGLLVPGYRDTGLNFSFHPVLKNCFELFRNGELSFLHACGLPVRDRSHFKSQDLMATGGFNAAAKTGWLAQIMSQLPRNARAIAFGPTLPLILKGTPKSFNWSSPQITPEDESLMKILGENLYQGDPELGGLYGDLERIEKLAGGFRRAERNPDPFETVGKMMAGHDGPDIGYISLGNWDTHDNQVKRIAKEFETLDTGLATLRKTMKTVWDDVIITIVSEFGRSVHENGTQGSDHGTGGLCLIVGGAADGGRDLGHWPGLEEKDLFENRDVKPVYDVRTVFAEVAQNHLGMSEKFVKNLFPKVPENYGDMQLIRRKKGFFGFV